LQLKQAGFALTLLKKLYLKNTTNNNKKQLNILCQNEYLRYTYIKYLNEYR